MVLPDQFPQASAFDIVACRDCGMAYSTMAANPAEMEAYYASTESLASQLALPPDTVAPAWQDARLGTVAEMIALRLSDRDARILDVGCGSGALLAHLRARGFKALVGVDPTLAAAASGRSIGLDIREGTVTRLPHDLGIFDLVVLSHVVEHLPDPGHALDSLTTVLHPGGLVSVDVPDATRLAAFVKLPFLEFSTEHLNYFSGESLCALMGRRGFECVSLEPGTFVLQPGIDYPSLSCLFRLSERVHHSPPDPALALALRAYVAACERCVAGFDRRLEDKVGPGRSVAVRGMGDLAWNLLAATGLSRLEIDAYIDASPQKQRLTIGGRPIRPPSVALSERIPVILLSLLHEGPMIEAARADHPGHPIIPLSQLLPPVGTPAAEGRP